MQTLVTILHVPVCIFLMLTVLLQAGKGGGMGAAFGGGTSMGTVFGGSGAGNFLRRLTVAAAIVFMLTSMVLAWMATPLTDPLKEYWAQQQAAAAERQRAHQEAVKDDGKKGADDAKGEAKAPGDEAGESTLESTPAAGAATDDSKGAGDAADKKGADDKAATDKPVDSKAATDKSVDSKAATDKPASAPAPAPAPAAPEPAKPDSP